MTLEDQPPVVGGTTAIRNGTYVTEERTPGPVLPHRPDGALTLASILHDTYGCRITCRGGRLADDRHPSHAEAYLDTATRVLASLDAEGWDLIRKDFLLTEERAAEVLEENESLKSRVRDLEEALEWK